MIMTKTDYLNKHYEDVEAGDKVFKKRIQSLLDLDWSKTNQDIHIALKAVMRDWDHCRDKEALREQMIYAIYGSQCSEEYLEYYRETRKGLAEEDSLEIDENPNCDSKISERHHCWLNREEDDEETTEIVHQRMLNGLF